MAKIQSEIIVAIIAAVVAVAVWRVARNPQLAVLAIAMLYVVARSVIARAFQELPKSSPLRALVPVIIAVVPQMAAPITSGYSINSVRRTPPGRAK